MLPEYPVSQVLEFLRQQGSREIHPTDAEFPKGLASERGQSFLVPVPWAPKGALVVFFRPTFPDTLPHLFLPQTTERDPLIAHVNHLGEICCFEPGTVVNPAEPLAVLHATLRKGEEVWKRSSRLDPAALLVDVERELSAYWQGSEWEPLFITDEAVELTRILKVESEPRGPGRILRRLSEPNFGKVVDIAVCLIVDVPRERLLSLLTSPKETLLSLDGLTTSIAALRVTLKNSHFRKRCASCWFLLRCETTAGPVYLGLKAKMELPFNSREEASFHEHALSWLKNTSLLRLQVQDLRSERLRRRSAGAPQAVFADVRFALVGCGSLGGFLADGLARAGVNRFLLLDPQILLPENLARHFLDSSALYKYKALALAAQLRLRFCDLNIEAKEVAAQTPEGRKLIAFFDPGLILSATGDTNTDLTLSEACRKGEVGDCCFTWVEPNLAAGHLVYQPRSASVALHDLHEQVEGPAYYYRHRVVLDPRSLMRSEAGCQTAFTPYSGADLLRFAHAVVHELALLSETPPSGTLARRWTNAGWETVQGP